MSNINDLILDEFQYTVDDLLIRNKSILDIITKLQDSTSRINRTTIKAVTQCGCLEIHAKKQNFDTDDSIEQIKNQISSHTEGTLCEDCKDVLEKDLGRAIFYLAALCNTFDLNLYDILVKELDRVKMLGNFSLR